MVKFIYSKILCLNFRYSINNLQPKMPYYEKVSHDYRFCADFQFYIIGSTK